MVNRGRLHNTMKNLKDEIKREVGSIYGIPIKTFDPDNLLDEMKKAKDGTVFVIGENIIKHHEGEDTVEVVMCQVFRGKDETPPKGNQ